MKFAADEGVDRQIVERLRQDGHTVGYVAEFDPGTSDQDVLSLANREGAVLLTADKDFGEMVYRQHLVHPGVIVSGTPMALAAAPTPAPSRARVR